MVIIKLVHISQDFTGPRARKTVWIIKQQTDALMFDNLLARQSIWVARDVQKECKGPSAIKFLGTRSTEGNWVLKLLFKESASDFLPQKKCWTRSTKDQARRLSSPWMDKTGLLVINDIINIINLIKIRAWHSSRKALNSILEQLLYAKKQQKALPRIVDKLSRHLNPSKSIF